MTKTLISKILPGMSKESLIGQPVKSNGNIHGKIIEYDPTNGDVIIEVDDEVYEGISSRIANKQDFELYFERDRSFDCRSSSYYEGPILIEKSYSGIDIKLHGFLQLKDDDFTYKIIFFKYDPFKNEKIYRVLLNKKKYFSEFLHETNDLNEAKEYVYSHINTNQIIDIPNSWKINKMEIKSIKETIFKWICEFEGNTYLRTLVAYKDGRPSSVLWNTIIAPEDYRLCAGYSNVDEDRSAKLESTFQNAANFEPCQENDQKITDKENNTSLIKIFEKAIEFIGQNSCNVQISNGSIHISFPTEFSDKSEITLRCPLCCNENVSYITFGSISQRIAGKEFIELCNKTMDKIKEKDKHMLKKIMEEITPDEKQKLSDDIKRTSSKEIAEIFIKNINSRINELLTKINSEIKPLEIEHEEIFTKDWVDALQFGIDTIVNLKK